MKDKTIDQLFAAFIGTFIGAIHGLILWATMNTGATIMNNGTQRFIPASYYNNMGFYQLAFEVTAIIDATALIIVLSSGWWLPKVMSYHENFIARRYGDEEEDGGDE